LVFETATADSSGPSLTIAGERLRKTRIAKKHHNKEGEQAKERSKPEILKGVGK